MKISYIEIDMSGAYSQRITDANIKIYSGISENINPVHMNDEYAKKTKV